MTQTIHRGPLYVRPSRGRLSRYRGDDGDLFTLIAVVAGLYGVTVDDIFGLTRGHSRAAAARQLAIYLIRVLERRRTVTEIADLFSRDGTTVCHACQAVEDRREDPEYDAMVAALEHQFGREAAE